jgi:hypothetical protein
MCLKESVELIFLSPELGTFMELGYRYAPEEKLVRIGYSKFETGYRYGC